MSASELPFSMLLRLNLDAEGFGDKSHNFFFDGSEGNRAVAPFWKAETAWKELLVLLVPCFRVGARVCEFE